MDKIIEYKIKNKNQVLKIYYDDSAEAPEQNEELFLIYSHHQFGVKKQGFNYIDICKYLVYPKKPEPQGYSEEEYKELIEQWEDDKDFPDFSDYYIFKVFAYIHGGVSLSLQPDGDRFDTSSSGFVLVKKDCEFFENNIQDGKEVQPQQELAKSYAESLIQTWNTYLSGNVYGYKLFEKINVLETLTKSLTDSLNKKGFSIKEETVKESLDLKLISELEEFNQEKEIDSCWGFYENGNNYENILEHLGLTNDLIEKI